LKNCYFFSQQQSVDLHPHFQPIFLSLKISTKIKLHKQMNEEQGHHQEKEKSICCGGLHCLKLNDKEHSTQFIHLYPVNFSFSVILTLSHLV
jgi:hypothetical protein